MRLCERCVDFVVAPWNLSGGRPDADEASQVRGQDHVTIAADSNRWAVIALTTTIGSRDPTMDLLPMKLHAFCTLPNPTIVWIGRRWRWMMF